MKRKVWTWLLGLFGAMGLIAGLVLWDAHRRATATFERHDRDVKQGIVRLRGSDLTRPVLFGPAVDGNAWDLYIAALNALDALTPDEEAAIPEVDATFVEGQLVDDFVLKEIYVKYAPQIDQLREALRRRTVDPGYAYESGFSMEFPHITKIIKAEKFLAGGIAHHHRMGAEGEAAELAAIGLGMNQDTARQGPLVSGLVRMVCDGIILDACRTQFSGHEFSPQELRQFAVRLDLLDSCRPGLDSFWEVEHLYMRQGLVDAGFDLKFMQGFPGGAAAGTPWKYLYSWRLMRANALNETESFFKGMDEFQGLPVERQAPAAADLMKTYERHSNPVIASMFPGLGKVPAREAVALAGRRLLRTAVAVALFEEEQGRPPASLSELVPKYLPAVPSCPLSGKPFGYAPGKVWAFGIDGEDDGGEEVPDFSKDDGGDKDLLWRVKRR